MGLDNGIIIYGVTRKQLPPWIKYPSASDYGEGVEICYWRKWWPFRNQVMSYLCGRMYPNEARIALTIENIRWIRKQLIYCIENPEDATNGYWEDEVVRKIAKNARFNLFWLIIYMRFHPEAEVYFYDSF